MKQDHPVVERFVTPMRRRFTVPQGLPQEGFLADMIEALSAYTAYQLECAANWFRDNREQRSFPTIAECRRACERYTVAGADALVARKWETEEERRSRAIIERQREQDAFRICRCELGRQAHDEGWLQSMVEFATDHGRQPEGREIDALKAQARRVDEHLHEDPGGKFYPALCNLRQQMKDRAFRRVFGEPERVKPRGQIVTGADLMAMDAKKFGAKKRAPDLTVEALKKMGGMTDEEWNALPSAPLPRNWKLAGEAIPPLCGPS